MALGLKDFHRGPVMPDRREWLQAAGMALLLWTGFELWTETLNAIRGPILPMRYWAGHALCIVAACLFSLAGFALVRAIEGLPPVLRFVIVTGALVVSAPAYALSMPALQLITPVAPEGRGEGAQLLLWESVYWLIPFTLWYLLVLILESGRKARVREANLSAALIAARDAEIRALHYQVNPHFLYNALNAIATLILDGRNAHAERMVLRLSDFFRSSLTRDPLAEVRLADEVAQQRLYLELEELRYPDCLEIVVNVPAELADAEAPSLILQPLVENAVKHGVHAPGQLTRIEIAAWAEGDSLVVQVTDNGPGGGGPAGTGVGIANVRKRLEARFGRRAGVEAGPHPERGYVAQITLPLRFARA